MRSSNIGAAGAASRSVAREWKGMALSTCRSLIEARLHPVGVESAPHDAQWLPSQSAEDENQWHAADKWLGDPVVRSVEKRRVKEW